MNCPWYERCWARSRKYEPSTGRHGVAILSCRENLGFEPNPVSDCAPLVEAADTLRGVRIPVRAMQDATRGAWRPCCTNGPDRVAWRCASTRQMPMQCFVAAHRPFWG